MGKTGAIFTGQWKGGFRDGFGEQTWNDGAKYSGEWRENRAHGKGRFIHVDGDIYMDTGPTTRPTAVASINTLTVLNMRACGRTISSTATVSKLGQTRADMKGTT